MDLKLPIAIADELSDDIIASRGLLDLASGQIEAIEYEEWDVRARGVPVHRKDYEFTCGTLSHGGRDLEFQIEVNRVTGHYSVSANELLEIKKKAAALFKR